MYPDQDSIFPCGLSVERKIFAFCAQVTHSLNWEKQKPRQSKADEYQVECQLAPVSCQKGTHSNKTYVDCTGQENVDVTQRTDVVES